MRIQIITCNSLYEGGKCIDCYHEIHEIDNLRNVNHIVATINSVINNNLLYKSDRTKLDCVVISGDKFIPEVMEYYNDNPNSVPIQEVESYLSII